MELNKTSVSLWLISSNKVKGISFFKMKYNRKGFKQRKKNKLNLTHWSTFSVNSMTIISTKCRWLRPMSKQHNLGHDSILTMKSSVFFLCFKRVLKFFSLHQINLFLVFSDCFNVLMSKIFFKKLFWYISERKTL